MSADAAPVRRHTRQRAAVVAALGRRGGFVSAQDLHAALRADGDTVGLATVYRSLQALSEDGQVDVRRTADGEALYRRCSTGHHHHLVCRSCGAAVEDDEIDEVGVFRVAARAARRGGEG